jgi:hypothetical protein
MAANPRIRRLTLVPQWGPNDELRRYRLARLDEIALATPPDRSLAESRERASDAGRATVRPAAGPAPRA